jgi:hypothetical protein
VYAVPRKPRSAGQTRPGDRHRSCVAEIFDGTRLTAPYEAEARSILDLPVDDFADTTAYAELDQVGSVISCALLGSDPARCRP